MGKNWISCNNAIILMISIVKWCAQQHVDGVDDYYERLSCAHRGRHPILIKEKTTDKERQYYSREEMNGWYIFVNLGNQAKKIMIDRILSSCIRENGKSPVQGQDLQVEMSNG